MEVGDTLAINELNPDTSLSQLFDYQMKIHCEGKLLTQQDIFKITRKLPLKWYDTRMTKYHFIQLFKKI